MSDLDQYLTDEMIEQGRKALTFGIMGCGKCCGENPPDELDHLDFDVARAHVAARAVLAAVLPDIIRQAKAEAWEEGHAAGCTDPYARYGECGCGPNPYRADQIEAGR
ncbi:hypothetical protein [Tessaracoccus massiliensis]|uniref:hypothetical protein n=1 Tax=Tessaracoccus massiliensis TaxID=1522311 RepID=UPI00058BE993|nr:hypothetical protein [Tessaracoccus massiliensis]